MIPARILCSTRLGCDFGRTFESRRLEASHKAMRVAAECHCRASPVVVTHTAMSDHPRRFRTCCHSQMSSCTRPSTRPRRCAFDSCRIGDNCSCMDCVGFLHRSDPSCSRSACTRSEQFDKYHDSIVVSWRVMMYCGCWHCFDDAPTVGSASRHRADTSPWSS